ncbi:hypothetical protein VVD49_16365 [Uliginosibacterium sp. H3]|uniref:ATP-binding protein n=1 Tax=Uliginosibacterium silvisoli TaxID=3114758 RepID=A0ABU6K7Q8_9RHOO|nr:hypothetical protein [Uliginosibacterium sp. H3]
MSGRGKITQGMQQHLARAILDYPSVRALARGEGLALETVLDALKDAAADGLAGNHGFVEAIAIRSLRIEPRGYWLAINPLDLKTAVFVGDCEENLKRFVRWVSERSPRYVDLPLDTSLARLLKSELPNAALTISAPEIFSFTEGILQACAKRQSYQLGGEGLTLKRAYQLSSQRSDLLFNVEQRCFDELAGTAPFWNSYLVQDRLFSLLEAREKNYLQAMQEALRLATAENHPMFVTAYRELSQLDQLGVTLQFDERYSIIHSKLKRLSLWMRRDGGRFEFPLFEALAGLFLVGFDGFSLPEALWRTLKEIADLMGFSALLRPSAAECSVIISAHFLTERKCATSTE